MFKDGAGSWHMKLRSNDKAICQSQRFNKVDQCKPGIPNGIVAPCIQEQSIARLIRKQRTQGTGTDNRFIQGVVVPVSRWSFVRSTTGGQNVVLCVGGVPSRCTNSFLNKWMRGAILVQTTAQNDDCVVFGLSLCRGSCGGVVVSIPVEPKKHSQQCNGSKRSVIAGHVLRVMR